MRSVVLAVDPPLRSVDEVKFELNELKERRLEAEVEASVGPPTSRGTKMGGSSGATILV